MNINTIATKALKNKKLLSRVGGTFLLLMLFLVACSPRKINSQQLINKPAKKVVLTQKQQEEKENLLIQAKKESSLADLEAARKTYLKALKLDPECDVCFYELAILYYRANYLINAFNFSKAAYDIDSTNVWYKRQLANLASMTGNYAEAEKLYSSLFIKDSQTPEIYYTLASVYENMRKYDKAIALYDSVQSRFGFNEEVAARIQEIYAATGNHAQSIAEAKKLVEYDPEDARFWTLLGDAYAQALNDSMAVASYNSAMAVDSTFPPAILGKAEIMRKSGNFDEYFANLEAYCKSDKIDDKGKVEYLSLVLNLPSFSEHFKPNVQKLFDILNNKYPDSNEVKYLHASFLMQTGLPDDAIKLLKDLIKTDSTNHYPWSQMLSMEFSLMRWNDLKADADKAILAFPNRSYFYMYRGFANWQLKDLNNAANDLEHAISISNKNDEGFLAQAHAFLGDLYYDMGKEKKAFENYDKVLEIDSLNATVLNNYAYYLAIKGQNLEYAYNMSKKAIELEPSSSTFLDTFGWILYLQKKYTEARAIFRQCLAAGGKNSGVTLDHYADVLYALGEYDTASIYWEQALEKPDTENKEEIKQKLLKLKKK